MAYLSLSPAPCCSGRRGGRGSGEAGGAQIVQLTVTCPLPLTTHTRVCQDRQPPKAPTGTQGHQVPHEAASLHLCPPRGSSPWLLPDGPHSCGSLPGPRVGEGQIPGAGASQKRGSVSLKRQRPQAPLAKLHGPWGLSEVHRSGDVKRGNVWEQVSGVRVQR